MSDNTLKPSIMEGIIKNSDKTREEALERSSRQRENLKRKKARKITVGKRVAMLSVAVLVAGGITIR